MSGEYSPFSHVAWRVGVDPAKARRMEQARQRRIARLVIMRDLEQRRSRS